MNAQRSIAIIAFLITGWIIASLALTGNIVQSTAPLSVGPFIEAVAAAGGDVVLTVALVIMSVVLFWIVRDRKLLAEALSDMFSRRKGKETRKSNRNLRRDVVGTILFFAILFAIRFAGLPAQSQPQKGGSNAAGSSFFIIPGFDAASFQSSLLVAYHFLAVWAFQIIFLAIAGLSGIILVRAIGQLKAPVPMPTEFDSVIVEETMGVVRDSYRDLQESDDYRKSILGCYQQLCEIFEPKGSISHRLLTARELRTLMIEQFGPAEQPISTLTGLFEEARYSLHQISAEMRDRALLALRKIEDCLRHPSEGTFEAIQ